jgi:RHS repeat-associated protein
MMAMSASGTAVSMVYDAFGNRVGKSVSGVVTRYLVDDLNPTGYPQVFDELVGGAVTRTYTYGLQRIDEEQVINSAWTPSFYGYDGGGNVRTLTNSAGAITDSYEYDAYGNSFTVSGTTPNEMMYRGEQYDTDLGLYYLRARYYNPLTGRFMSRDPESGDELDPKSLHKYLYAKGDPIDGIDPTGRIDVIQTALSDAVVVSSPLEINVELYSKLVAGAICGIGKVIARIAKQVTQPTNTGLIPSPIPHVPLWTFSVLAAICNATGY